MATKKRDIIDIGDGWACALHTKNQCPSIQCFFCDTPIREIPISTLIESVPFNHSKNNSEISPANDPFSIVQIPEPKSLIKVASLLHAVIRKTALNVNAYVVSIDNEAPSLVISVGGNSRHQYQNAEIGNMTATTEAAQNMACTGATPVAFFKLPILSNGENQPIMGLLGLLPKATPCTNIAFKRKGEMIYLLGRSVEDISSSEYLYSFHHIHPSPAPYINSQEQNRLQTVLFEAINNNLISSIHSITRGGIFTSLIESSIPNQLGFDVTTDVEIREDAFLFGEALGRYIVSTSEEKDASFVDMMTQNKIQITTLGHTTRGEIRIDDISFGFISDFT